MKARPVVIASFLLRVDFHDFRRRSGKARVKNARILPLSLFPHKILVTFIAVTPLATFTFTLLPVGVLYLFHKRDYRACNPKRDDISLRRMSDKIRRLPNRSGIFFFFTALSLAAASSRTRCNRARTNGLAVSVQVPHSASPNEARIKISGRLILHTLHPLVSSRADDNLRQLARCCLSPASRSQNEILTKLLCVRLEDTSSVGRREKVRCFNIAELSRGTRSTYGLIVSAFKATIKGQKVRPRLNDAVSRRDDVVLVPALAGTGTSRIHEALMGIYTLQFLHVEIYICTGGVREQRDIRRDDKGRFTSPSPSPENGAIAPS